MEGLDDFKAMRQATALRPLLGLTVLLVEDSRFACEAVRMLCLRSGARIRRADSLQSARKHLNVYRPSVVIIDVGLPDGSGLPLIADLARGSPRIDVVLGTSGDLDAEGEVIAAGADGFLSKPIASLAAFQSAILAHLPADRQPPGPRLISDEVVEPDRIAFHDDLSHVAEVLRTPATDGSIDYVTQFLGGVARSADDSDLHDAVHRLKTLRQKGAPLQQGLSQLTDLVESRLAAGGPL
ncbi:response regulator [Yoonia sp. R2331]|uniref:response regulator n=1 Tax=Yoonia sp. R2331 TaxID=3237238 RepID=UPI0034E3AB86